MFYHGIHGRPSGGTRLGLRRTRFVEVAGRGGAFAVAGTYGGAGGQPWMDRRWVGYGLVWLNMDLIWVSIC